MVTVMSKREGREKEKKYAPEDIDLSWLKKDAEPRKKGRK